ncbi:MAG: SpoIID/LytB domain-containing protein [Bacteroidales bacterium]|nr:SpoIID/LytB domain-containing protein [Bacteroidales bacterium]
MKKIFLLLIIAFSLPFTDEIKAEETPDLRIRIFSTVNISSVTVNSSFGTYFLDGSLKIKKQDKITLAVSEGKVSVSVNDSLMFKRDSVKISSQDIKCFLQITPANAKARRYDNNLTVKLTKDKKFLLLINEVTEDNYLAGVVQSEAGGASDNVEFFKVQAVCCRSYMNRFINKHVKDGGYNLCDDVNCQVYLSRANKTQCIEGAAQTAGEVIVDENGKIIETLFHSNSGGQTVNSEDVWGNKIPYLRSVKDSFSVNQPNYKWEKEIKEKDWLNYFRNNGVDVKDYNNKRELLNFSQAEGRKSKIFGIPLTQIRRDFKLKSTFFSTEPWGSNVKLKGYGYGHGVGMSQEGAVNMCENGYEYWEVIEFYYQGVKIKNLLKETTSKE